MFIFGIVVIAAVIFTGGMFVGTAFKIFTSISTTSFFENQLTDAATTFMLVKMIDNKETEEAKSCLNLRLDTNILSLGMLVRDYGDSKNGALANIILSRIAKHRQEHPVLSSQKEVQDMIQGFLDKAVEEVDKKGKQNQASEAIGARGAPQPQR